MKAQSWLIIQGGGNNLLETGYDDTVKDIVDFMKTVEEKRMNVALIGVLRQPREGHRDYERK